MRHLPKGAMFFAKVHCCTKHSRLFTCDISAGDIIFCEMLDEDNDDPSIEIKLEDDRSYVINDQSDGYESFLVFEGNIDGTSFIDEESKRIAMAMIS